MHAIDYSKLLDGTAVRSFVPCEATPDEGVYECDEGIRFHSEHAHGFCWESVRLTEGALLLASDDPAGEVVTQRQVVNQSDWVHIQFRLTGGGCEDIGGSGV